MQLLASDSVSRARTASRGPLLCLEILSGTSGLGCKEEMRAARGASLGRRREARGGGGRECLALFFFATLSPLALFVLAAAASSSPNSAASERPSASDYPEYCLKPWEVEARRRAPPLSPEAQALGLELLQVTLSLAAFLALEECVSGRSVETFFACGSPARFTGPRLRSPRSQSPLHRRLLEVDFKRKEERKHNPSPRRLGKQRRGSRGG